MSCEVTFAIADKVPLSFSSSADYAKSLGIVLGSKSFSAYVESAVPNATGVTSVTSFAISEVTSAPSVSLISSVNQAPTLTPSSKSHTEERVMLAPFLSIVGAVFFAGLLIGYITGSLLGKMSTIPGNDAVKSGIPKTQQKKRPPRNEKVIALERPPDMFDEETPRSTMEVQKKDLPNKKRPSQTDNILIEPKIFEGDSTLRPPSVECTTNVEERNDESGAMDLKKIGQLIFLGIQKRKEFE